METNNNNREGRGGGGINDGQSPSRRHRTVTEHEKAFRIVVEKAD
jgi:hypothetical protein